MIDLLDKALRRLLGDAGAAAAVVWGIPRPGSAKVLTSFPSEAVPAGSQWPTAHHGAVDAVERDPDRLARLLPAALRETLPGAPTAARSFQLGHGMFLTVVWCAPINSQVTETVPETVPETVDAQSLDEVAHLAGITADQQFNRGELQRLRAVVNGLHDAVATVDLVGEQTHLNKRAAQLLGLAEGRNSASDFRAALTALAERAINSEEFGAAATQFRTDPVGDVEFMLRFAESPTHLLVTSKAVRHQNFQGRVWVFYDESALSQALESAERSLDLLQISSDGMLEPQALMEGIRDTDGRIVDFLFRDVNRAACEYLRAGPEDLVGRGLLEIMPNMGTAGLVARYVDCIADRQPVILDNFGYPTQLRSGPRYFDLRANHAGGDFISVTWRDITDRFESQERYRLLADNAGDVVIHVRDGRISWTSPSIAEALGAPPEHWIGRELKELIPAEDRGAHDKVNWLAPDRAFIPRGRLTAADGTVHWVYAHVKTFYDADGNPDGYTSSFRIVDDEVRAVADAEEARRRQAEADARYRRLMDNSAVGMCMVTPGGRYDTVNQALCDFFGLDAETLTRTTWQELTPGETLERDLRLAEDVLAGRRDHYRVTKQYIHSDGHLIWGDLSVSALRDTAGQVEYFVSQVVDITAEMEARRQVSQRDQQNRALAQRLQAQTYRLKSELESAANYVRSILPRDMEGPVRVSSRYIPSRELGGDCFDHTWIDDEHLIVYLIDVSGHGIAPALLSVSVHNLLRSGTLPLTTLLAPELVLAELNAKFQMDQHGDNYFTMWYGVYESSTRTMRYASAGHPPALAFSVKDGGVATEMLTTQALPLGMFADTEFSCDTYTVPPGGQLVIYSDGAFELPLPEGNASLSAFVGLCREFAATPGWTIDELIRTLQSLTTGGLFADDCSLVQLTFP